MKRVFISHSEKDKNIANLICKYLEDEGILCWIAPRDIPYGEDWAKEITEAIENSCVFIFIFSKNSNMSRQCPKEVNIADNVGIPIICLVTEQLEMNPTLRYHLTLSQFMQIDISDLKNQADNILSTVRRKMNSSLIDEKRNSLDSELEKAFEKLFGEKNAIKEKSDFQILLDKKISESHVNSFERNNKNSENIGVVGITEENFDEYGNYIGHVDYNGRIDLHGLNFPIIDDQGDITVVYRIRKKYNIADFSFKYILDRLDFLEERLSDGKIERRFFVDEPDEYTQLSIVTISKAKSSVIVNSGILDSKNGIVKISREPSSVHIDNSIIDGTKECEYDYSDNGVYVILNLETGEEVPIVKKQGDNGKEKNTIRLDNQNQYFTFSVVNKDSNKNQNIMDAEDVGNFYMMGLQGFPQNTYNALMWYEKAKTAGAYKKMVEIFTSDPIFADEELAEKYEELYKTEYENKS